MSQRTPRGHARLNMAALAAGRGCQGDDHLPADVGEARRSNRSSLRCGPYEKRTPDPSGQHEITSSFRNFDFDVNDVFC